MKEIVLTSSIYETNGGCNACVPYEVTVYKINLNGINYPLDELTVSNLVNMIARKNGYQQETVVEMFEDKTLFKNDEQTITYSDESGILHYSNGSVSIQTIDMLPSKELIFEKVNDILTQVFHLEACDFKIEKDDTVHR